MKSNKHIVMLTPGFPSNEADDSCIPALQVFVKAFHELFSEYKLSIITFHYPFTSEKYLWNGIPVFPCNGRNKKWLRRLSTLRKAKSFFGEINEESHVDMIHSFWLGECAIVGEEISRKFNIPHLNTLMGQDVREVNRHLKKKMLRNIPKVAQSERQAIVFEKNTGQKSLAVIPFGVEEERNELQQERNIDILAVGSLIELKRYDLLIRAIAQLKNDFPTLKATLAGGGPMKNNLEKLSNDLNVEENIQFTGTLPRKDILALMTKSKIFFHPSSFEGFGFVFLEARKYGLAVVSSDVGGAVVSGNWKVANTLDEMVEALKFFIRAQKNFEGEIIYSVNETAEKYEKIYSELIEEKN